jgi:hypothetical protein
VLRPILRGDARDTSSGSEIAGGSSASQTATKSRQSRRIFRILLVRPHRIDDHVRSPSLSTQVWVVCGEPSGIEVVAGP